MVNFGKGIDWKMLLDTTLNGIAMDPFRVSECFTLTLECYFLPENAVLSSRFKGLKFYYTKSKGSWQEMSFLVYFRKFILFKFTSNICLLMPN